MTITERIQDRRIGVVGMASSGVAAALLARRHGGNLFVSDSANAEILQEPIKQLSEAGIEYEVGGHTARLLENDYLIVSPGVPQTCDMLIQAREQGLPIFSEIEFASWLCPGRIVAITGSNGKTTTTVLVGELLKTSGIETFVCGNIGLPFADVVDRMSSTSVAVVELSSYQLEAIENFHPHIAAILNITPDHLDRHGSFDKYRNAKYRITENQTSDEYLILNLDDKALTTRPPKTDAAVLFNSLVVLDQAASSVRNGTLFVRQDREESSVIAVNEIKIPGRHNLQNIAVAVIIADLLGVRTSDMAKVLREFSGVEHRLEDAGAVAGIRFINDSKSTNVDSLCVALKAIESPLYLIAGGRDKGSSYEPILAAAGNKVKGLLAIGEAKEKIFSQLGRSLQVEFADSLEEAVARCFALASPGDTVLLSPGCASFDMFENFEERGRVFKKAVRSLKNGKKKSETVTS